MGNINADVIGVELTLEASAASTLKPKMRGHAKDTRRFMWMEGDNTLRYAWDSTRLADQTGTYGLAVIGVAGITGITPSGGTSGAAATAAAMLIGMRDSMVLKSPYNSTINTIQPTADYIPLTIKGFASGVQDLLELQTSAATVAWFDSKANLTLSRGDSGNAVSIRAINSNNSNTASNALAVLSVGGGSAGDPYINFNVNGASDWTIGTDNSVSGDPFKFSNSNAIGTSDLLILDPANNRAQFTSSANSIFALQIINTNTGSQDHAILDIYSFSSTGRVFVRYNGTSHVWANGLNALNSDVYSISLGGNLGTGDALIINTSLDVNIPNTLSVTGVASYASRITFNGNGSTATGSILKTAADGLLLRGITGSSNDFGLYSAAGTLIFANTTGTSDLTIPGGDLTISRSTAGLQNLFSVVNTDNSNSSSRAKVFVGVGGSSAGDPTLSFNVASTTTWSFGIDNSVSGDPLKISFGSTLGTTDALTIDSALLTTFGGSVICGGGTGSYFQAPRGSSDPGSPVGGMLYYNTAGNHLFGYNGAAWIQIF